MRAADLPLVPEDPRRLSARQRTHPRTTGLPKLDGARFAQLAKEIREHSATVGIVGLGYVGLPLVLQVSATGFPVIGVDTDGQRIESLRLGRSHILDVSDSALNQRDGKRFTVDFGALRHADVVILTVPTPLTDGVPDLTAVKEASAAIARHVRRGQLIIVESTTYPGTTEELVRPILETSNLIAGSDFALAYSPERIDPGSGWTIRDMPKIVSGISKTDTDLAQLFYSQFVEKVITTPSPRDAEMAKLIENTFRQVNIALINELAVAAPDLGVDIWAAVEAAATKPFGFMPFWPGPGVGGHCIPLDPSYLSWRVGQRVGFGLRFVEHAREVNGRMPAYVAARIADALNDFGKPLRGSKVMVVGLAYKAGVEDLRGSPAIAVMERLARAGAQCSYHDPFVPTAQLRGKEIRSEPLTRHRLATQDCIAILTAHPNVDYEAIVKWSRLVFDARGVTRGGLDGPNVVRL
jgi:UDP-N-acetyl-D-glucosamine dehydrogenase